MLSANISLAQSNEMLAEELFEDKEYTKALPHFKELLKLYPNEAMFQYYYGVCLTETNQFGLKTRKLLLQSAQDEEIPSNVFFYIAKNYHADNNFDTALQYYERFDDYARNKEKRRVNFKEFYNLCLNENNPFKDSAPQPTSYTEPEKPQKEETDSIAKVTTNLNKELPDTTTNLPTGDEMSEKKQPLSIPEHLTDSLINFSVTGNINYLRFNQFKTDEGKVAFIEGDKNNRKLEQTIKTTDSLRKEYNKPANNQKKGEIANRIIELELEAIKLKSLSDNAFINARKEEFKYWNDAPGDALSELIEENDSIKEVENKKTTPKENNFPEQTFNVKPDSTLLSTAQPDSTEKKTAPQKTTPKMKTENDETEKTNNIKYKVQIGAYSKELPAYVERMYNKLSVLRKIDHYTDDNGIVVYTVGNVDNFDDAVQLQKQIRQEGIKDAFVVAYNNGKRITLSEAREIQKND
jgi:cell division septation protein DedD